ncbi:TenA family transcriptional regulator [Streptomyces sp. NPDC048473]|uniref:TenA family transcriptional regulator n=1 Tax=unclassified Streptomyces TaxID=2593676 RepID=UPI00371D1D3A
MPRVTALADQALTHVDIINNPYLLALEDGSLALEDFRASQEQFGFAVTYFARPMASLISRIEAPGDRVGILRNIVEEHGDFAPHAFHHATFRRFLASIGSADPAHLDALTVSSAVHAFNSVLSSLCTLEDLPVAISCMGVIEHAFAQISASIGRSVVERGWVAKDDLVHYALHAEIDERHAEDFFTFVEPSYDAPNGRRRIEQGLNLGAYVFNRLYTESICPRRLNVDHDGHGPPRRAV